MIISSPAPAVTPPALYESKSGKGVHELSWWAYHANDELLSIIYERLGEKAFLECLEIIASFPDEVNLFEGDKVVSIIKNMPNTNAVAKMIMASLVRRNPTKYYDLKNEWEKIPATIN